MPLFPIGYDNFREIREKGYVFVDKSLFINDILQESSKVILITRPRRFGKTLNMSMLQHFFASEVQGQATQGLFAGLKITQNPEAMQHQGQYPVINISFKDMKFRTFDQCYEKLTKLMSELYTQHSHLLTCSQMKMIEKQDFEHIMNCQASEVSLKSALRQLTRYLHTYYQVKPIVLIDEYDTPMLSAYLHHYYEEAIDLIRGLLSEALKGNDDLEKAVLTGILRVAKEGMFSGLNNVEVYSVFEPGYSEYFGFTETEVEALLVQMGLVNSAQDVRRWYNGYQIGKHRVYNPWSITHYLKYGGRCAAYWLNTSDNLWMQDLLIRSSLAMKIGLEQLLQGQAIEVKLPDQFVFADLERDDATLWSLLVMAGYLTVTEVVGPGKGTLGWEDTADIQTCYLEIPNHEVRATYCRLVRRWLSNDRSSGWYDGFMTHLLQGEIEAWSHQLEEVVLQIVSYHDPAKYPEAFYHGLLLGILAYLHQTGYAVKSNRESGQGRYDIMIIPQDTTQLGVLLELKQLGVSCLTGELSTLMAALTESAAEALLQMQLKRYDTELRQVGISRICHVALAFCGKHFQVQYAIQTYP